MHSTSNWKSGRAFAKQRLVDIMISRAEKGDMNSGMYIARAVYGLHDKAAAGAVTIENKPTFAFISPKEKDFASAAAAAKADGYAAVTQGSYAPTEQGEREYMDSIGQLEINDDRKPEKRDEMLRITMGNPPTPADETPPKAAPPAEPLGHQSDEDAERQRAFQAMADETTKARIVTITAGAALPCDQPRPMQRSGVTVPHAHNAQTRRLER
jgi:hypothetical protein